MTAPHLHLLVNHFPIVMTLLAEALLIFAMVRKNTMLIRTAMVGFVLTAIVTIVAGSTGEAASHALRGDPGIVNDAVREHAEAATWASLGAELLGAVALSGLIFGILAERKRKANGDEAPEIRRNAPPAWALWLTVVLGLWLNSVMFRVGHLGGLIRHPEIDPGWGASATMTSSITDSAQGFHHMDNPEK